MGKLKLQPSQKRSAKTVENKNVSVEALRRTLGFPEGTEFLGYAIYRKGSDEFLVAGAALPVAGVSVEMSWTRAPRSAACYTTLSGAIKKAEESADAVVVGLFDTGSQIMTVTMSANR